MRVIRKILTDLPKGFSLPVIIVEHISPNSDNFWIKSLNKICKLMVKEADEKEKIKKSTVYIAPPGYHLLIEQDFTFSLSSDERVNFSRPSIDVLFETAADAYKESLIGIILTGANNDGAKGLKMIKKNGGLTIVQDPSGAEVDIMPLAAILSAKPDFILAIKEIAPKMIDLQKKI
ncbi:MAG: chemotaxis protein CheB [Bacteroidetes bacterium]|nr:chemotaxis protein CheB [Bacteroidota bacterium]